MGIYTTNYNLFMPSIGEQGWGELVNGNFTIIDTTMAGLNTKLETLETEGDAVAARVGTLESKMSAVEGEVNGNLSCTSVTTSGNLTVGGTITGNFGGNISRVINVTPSNVAIDGRYRIDGCLLPYNNGATYSGTIKYRVTDSNRPLYLDFQVGTSITTMTNSSTSDTTITIPNDTVCAYMRGGQPNTDLCYVYIPIFS